MSTPPTTQVAARNRAAAPARSAGPSPTVVDLVVDNEELREKSKKSETRHSINYLAIIGGEAGVIVFLLWLTFGHFPQTAYVATQNAAAICSFVPIDRPNISEADVKDFAKTAVVSTYSTDYANYRRDINAAADRFMLPQFRDPFVQIMQSSDFLKDVVTNQFIVTATSTANQPPVVVRKGVLSGAYAWKVQVPLTFNYVSGRQRHEDHVVAEVTVSQTDPAKVKLNPSAIGVSWIDLKTALN
ncbi:hypothetical protein R70006_04995 [Paraburkholderia domus]|uniref:DotI/IcmL family type IV secretion protein n=1 Tax=Paraburkholderia domus TaxID=2793075 RepID=UPI0019137C93|nr:DotI/IcmL family type IV secretion protein [Paraburkholderia domus]MBK5051769.1 DotI/IcmL family type IV secretion protein [Burkholderia sp. R-70006]CAE6794247.1 hypothetical protein R70006_04995 [Paraburkholderia domus]